MADLVDQVRDALRQVLDPEAGLNIVDLGLIYDIEATDGAVTVTMTFTSPGCPAGEMLAAAAQQVVEAIKGVRTVSLDISFDPPWTPESISPDGRALLGW
jgi:metal-sulfur cluster biosynthetic enzyme